MNLIKKKETSSKFKKIIENKEKAIKSKEKAENKKQEIEKIQISIDEKTKKVEYELNSVKMKVTRTAIGNLTQKSLDILKDLKKN